MNQAGNDDETGNPGQMGKKGQKKWRRAFETDLTGLTAVLSSNFSGSGQGNIFKNASVGQNSDPFLSGPQQYHSSRIQLTEQPILEDWNEQRRLYGFPTR